MQRISTCLWFNGQAEKAVEFYASVFDYSKATATTYYDKAASRAAGRPEGSVMTIAFELDGREFLALNGSPAFAFTEAISLIVNCETQDEVDRYWSRLSEGGEEGPCGWLKDRFGLSWQVVPKALPELLTHADPAVAGRVMQALLQMKKIDIARLKQASAG